MKYLSLSIFLLISTHLVAQDKEKTSAHYALTIQADQLKAHLEIIASDEYAGRETATAGQKKAEQYLVDYFSELGLAPGNGDSFVQEYEVVSYKPDGSITAAGKQYRFLDDFYFYNKYKTDIQAQEIVFMGYGIDDPEYSDYGDTDVSGKILLILEDEPYDNKGRSLITGRDSESSWSYSWKKKYEVAVKKGAAGLLTMVNDFENKKELVQFYLGSPRMTLAGTDDGSTDEPPSIYVSPEMAKNLLATNDLELEKVIKKISKSKETIQSELKVPLSIDFLPEGDKMTSSNVVAFLEGTDKKEEILVITAHYDHLGQNGELIYNGADDDGSGTVTLLEIAEAFKKAKDAGDGPRRSILFMPVSGEEKGLLGSRYFTDNPTYPLENMIADLNIDMIGRHDTLHDHSNYVYLIGSDRLSSELHAISEEMNEEFTQLELDYTYNAKDDPNEFYQRSDHYNFAVHGIPVIFYFSGVHEDYHQATDTVDKIEFDKMTTIAKLIFHTAWELANREERIKVDQPIDWEE